MGLERTNVVMVGLDGSPSASAAASGLRAPAIIVVGTRGGGRFTSLVVGSTSHALLADAPCPVAVVRGQYTRPYGAHTGHIDDQRSGDQRDGFRSINV